MNNQLIDRAVTEKKAYVLGNVEDSTLELIEGELGTIIPEEYKSFIKQYGALSVNGHEIFGHAPSTHIDVVENTIQERKNVEILDKYIVIENPGFDGILIVMDNSGNVLEYKSNHLELLHSSFDNFLKNIFE